jgi:hypothetical protein
MSDIDDDEVRKIARKRLKRKADFKNYVFVWALVSALLTSIWLIATPGTLFWPGFAIAGMGLAAIFVWWDAYGPNRDITESDIDAEIERMRRGKN